MALTEKDLKQLEDEVAHIVSHVGRMLRQVWQQPKTVRYKEKMDPVTKYDIEVEQHIRRRLARLLPEAGYLVEEGINDEVEGLNWVIDPIDQTKNFVGQVPIFYVHVALMHDGDPILGVIYNPISRQLFSASKSNGTKLNGSKVIAQAKNSLDKAIIDIDFGGPSDRLHWRCQVVENLALKAFRVRMCAGSYAPYILTGGIDLYIVLNEKTKLVDQIPRQIITREAGLEFNNIQINSHRIIIAGHQNTVCEAMQVIEGVENIMSDLST